MIIKKHLNTIFLLLILLGNFGCGERCACEFEPCNTKKCKTIKDKTFGKSQVLGVDRQQYVMSTETIKLDMDEYNADAFNQLRESAFIVALKKLGAENREPGVLPFLAAFQNDRATIRSIINHDNQLGKIYGVYNEEGKYDCARCEYVYSMTVMTPKNKEYLIPEEIRNLIYSLLRQDKELKKIEFSAIEREQIRVNIASVILNLLKDPSFRAAIEPMWDKYQDVLSYLDPETATFFKESANKTKVMNFPSGSYQINTIAEMIINEVFDQIQKLIYQDPSINYKVVCIGYTDPTKIKKAIQYEGFGLYAKDNTAIQIDSDAHPHISPTIDSNQELSYARAFEGAKHLYGKFVEHKTFLEKGNVKVYYQGKGVAPITDNKWQRRRIEFSITQEPKNQNNEKSR